MVDHQPVDHHFNGVHLVALQLNRVVHVADLSIYPDANKASLAHLLEDTLVMPLATLDQRSHNLDPGARREAHQRINDLLGALLLHLPAALCAVRSASPCVQQPHIVIYLCHCPNRRAGIAADPLLINAHCRAQPFYLVHVWLIQLAQELPGIGGQRFYIPALPLGENGIKRQ